MIAVLTALLATLRFTVGSRLALQAEILALRHQLAVLHRQALHRPRLRPVDRLLWVLLSRVWPDWRRAVQIVKPETVLRWHRRLFTLAWRWKSRPRRPGRPPLGADVRMLIQQTQAANPLWGAPRIHGELQKLGFEVCQATVARYLARFRGPRRPSSQTWRTFLANHVAQFASCDFFTVPTVTFRVLFVFVVLSHARRRVLHVNVTAHPTAAWTAQQLREAFPWNGAPRFLLRARDAIYGADLRRTVRRMVSRKCSPHPGRPGRIPSWSG